MSIIDTTEDRFEHDIGGHQPVLLDFWAPWCGPCKALTPHLDTLDAKVGDRLTILKVNIDDNPALAKRFQVRGIPTLVFMSDGKEEGRLAGTTTARLNVTVEKWMGQHGVAARLGGFPETTTEAARTWSSFNGRAELRAACVERMRQIPDEPRTYPSKQFREPTDGREMEPGIPVSVTTVFDYIWALDCVSRPYEERRERMVRLAAAMPLGADLHAVAKALHYDMLYQSQWAVAGYVDDEEVLAVIDTLRDTHARDLAGEPVSASEWDSLCTRAILLAGVDGKRESMSRVLESMAKPLANEAWSDVMMLMTSLSHNDIRREPHWSDRDRVHMNELNRSFGALVTQAIGPRPQQPGTATTAWLENVGNLKKGWQAEQRDINPVFWERHDAYEANIVDSRQKMADYLFGALLSRFAPIAA